MLPCLRLPETLPSLQVGLLAVPAILAHAQYISIGAMIIEMAAALIIGAMVIVYDFATSEELY